MNREASLSECGKYRFSLMRSEDALFKTRGVAAFCMNNPSSADAEIDDQTVRKCWAYIRNWGFSKLIIVNTNPHRSTNPNAAVVPPEPILEENDLHIGLAATRAQLVVCAWGTRAIPELAERAKTIIRYHKPLHALELTISGTPKHPLYLKSYLMPMVWEAA